MYIFYYGRYVSQNDQNEPQKYKKIQTVHIPPSIQPQLHALTLGRNMAYLTYDKVRKFLCQHYFLSKIGCFGENNSVEVFIALK